MRVGIVSFGIIIIHLGLVLFCVFNSQDVSIKKVSKKLLITNLGPHFRSNSFSGKITGRGSHKIANKRMEPGRCKEYRFQGSASPEGPVRLRLAVY